MLKSSNTTMDKAELSWEMPEQRYSAPVLQYYFVSVTLLEHWKIPSKIGAVPSNRGMAVATHLCMNQ